MSMTPGSSSASDPQPLRFAVLRHEGIADPHFDLLVEVNRERMLLAWRCPQWPPQGEVVLHRLPDHRRIYLTYEGPVSAGRGSVTRVAAGQCRMLAQTPAHLKLKLVENSRAATFSLAHQTDDRWLLSPEAP
jgi:hypothetical protein